MSYESFKDMNVKVKQEGRPRSGSPDSVTMSIAANQAASNMENLDLDSFLATDATPGSDLDKLKKAMRAYKKNQTKENEKKVEKIFETMLSSDDKNVGKKRTLSGRKRYVKDESFRKVFFGNWRHNQTNPLTKEKNPAFFGGKRKKRRKTRKRRRKKRTKKKTRRKRRKSRKRKTKRRR